MKDRGILVTLGILAALTMFANIGGYSIYILDEAKNAECAREMLETGNMIVPTFNYDLRSDKPPLHYYFMMLGYEMFGVNEGSARFFSSLLGLLTLVGVFLFVREHIDRRAAMYAVMVLMSSIGFILQFHLAVPDPYLVFFMTSGLFSFYHGVTYGKKGWLYVGYAFVGLAVLSKGPIGIVLPIFIIAIHFGLLKRERFNRLISWKGVLLFLIISVPWFVFVGLETDGKWLDEFLFEHNFERYTTEKEGHGGSFLLMPLSLLLMMMPFTLLVIPAFISLWNDPKQVLKFSAVAVLITVIFFSFSATKLPNYLSPALPFLAIIVGQFLGRLERQSESGIYWVMAAGVLIILVPFGVMYSGDSNLKSSDWLNFGPLLMGGVLSIVFTFQKKILKGILSIAVAFCLTITVLFYTLVPRIDAQNPVKQSMRLLEGKKNVVSFHIFNPAFSFYLRDTIRVYSSLKDLERHLDEKRNTVILTRSNVLTELELLELDTLLIESDLFEGTETVILSERD